ncbi:MAG: hypothetical protein RLZ98_177 [Pseudomonadota bacterium]|jgi:tripartite-type tricarboxylate transporter receptor subunit TctC
MRKDARGSLGYLIKAVVAAGILMPASAHAQSPAEFFKGKNVTIRVGFGAGGGYDTTTRLVARYYGKHIPGAPNVLVENMPGAGGLRLANFMFNAAPKDGTMLAIFSAQASMEPLFGNDKAKFKADQFTWIGSMHTDINSCGVWKGAGVGINSFDDMLKSKKEIVFGSTGPQSETTKFPAFMKKALGAPVKVIEGFKGTKDINLAMRRGELDASCGMFESSVRGAYFDDYKNGDLKIIFQVGLDRKVPLFGNAAQVGELVKDKGKEMQQIAEMVFGPSAITRPIAAPPGIPADRAKALSDALMATMKDPGTIADGKKIGIEWDPMTGDKVKELMQRFYATPPSVVKKAIEFTSMN